MLGPTFQPNSTSFLNHARNVLFAGEITSHDAGAPRAWEGTLPVLKAGFLPPKKNAPKTLQSSKPEGP